MNRTATLSVVSLALAGCISSPATHRHAGIFVLDPATGVTYNVPLRPILTSGVNPAMQPRALSASTVSRLTPSFLESRDGAAPDAELRAAATGSISPGSHQETSERLASVVAFRATPSVASDAAHPFAVTRPLEAMAQPITLKLDTEFASAKQLVIFATGRASLGPTGRLAVSELVPWARQADKVHVQGGADSAGDAARNKELAIARAKAMSLAFMAASIDREKITTTFCASCYVTTNDTEQGRGLNRRVEVELVLQSELAARMPKPVYALERPHPVPLIQATALHVLPR